MLEIIIGLLLGGFVGMIIARWTFKKAKGGYVAIVNIKSDDPNSSDISTPQMIFCSSHPFL